MKLPEKKQQIIIASSAVIVICFVLFSYVPLAKAKKVLLEDRVEYSNENVKVSSQVELLPAISDQKSKLDSYVGNFDRKIPDSRQFAMLWEQMTETMKQHGLRDQSIHPGPQVEGEELICIPMSIECVGKPNQIFALFRSLESFERLVRVDTVELEKTGEADGGIRIKAGAKVYYRKVEE